MSLKYEPASTGDTIEVAQGEHSWPGKIFVDKAYTLHPTPYTLHPGH